MRQKFISVKCDNYLTLLLTVNLSRHLNENSWCSIFLRKHIHIESSILPSITKVVVTTSSMAFDELHNTCSFPSNNLENFFLSAAFLGTTKTKMSSKKDTSFLDTWHLTYKKWFSSRYLMVYLILDVLYLGITDCQKGQSPTIQSCLLTWNRWLSSSWCTTE